ncbi:MAG: large-conductance mechanosensitive channel protein MscL [Candidatus Kapabacteria bacterium]|jgi:large conductance mechanosensitive channel|nr:large-conductance mechanosensitive channel protein MscL [Candidatus Kapabacteria bacterium]
MGLMQEFKEFAVKGNVVDLAVGVIIGGAFGKIVSSLVDDVIMPPIGLALGGVNFKELALTLKAASVDGKVPAVMLKYGAFIQTVFDFAILAFVIFIMVKAINNLKKKEAAAPPPAPPEPSAQEKLLMEIRDALKK